MAGNKNSGIVALKERTIEYWLDEDKLTLLESYALDGYTLTDIARVIGIKPSLLSKWRAEYPEIDKALSARREIVDAKIESALIRTALGYQKREVKVTTVMKYGKVIETIKEVTESEQPPNVNAIQFYLCNRKKDTWRSISSKASLFDEMADNDKIEVVVRRASQNELSDGDSDSEDNLTSEPQKQLTDANITLRKRSEDERKEAKSKRQDEAAKKAKKQNQDVEIIEDDEEDWDNIDLDDDTP